MTPARGFRLHPHRGFGRFFLIRWLVRAVVWGFTGVWWHGVVFFAVVTAITAAIVAAVRSARRR